MNLCCELISWQSLIVPKRSFSSIEKSLEPFLCSTLLPGCAWLSNLASFFLKASYFIMVRFASFWARISFCSLIATRSSSNGSVWDSESTLSAVTYWVDIPIVWVSWSAIYISSSSSVNFAIDLYAISNWSCKDFTKADWFGLFLSSNNVSSSVLVCCSLLLAMLYWDSDEFSYSVSSAAYSVFEGWPGFWFISWLL